jgi:hypothetical protein
LSSNRIANEYAKRDKKLSCDGNEVLLNRETRGVYIKISDFDHPEEFQKIRLLRMKSDLVMKYLEGL